MGDTRFDLLVRRLEGVHGEDRWAHASLKALVEASPDPIVALDRDGRVTLWNPAAERVFGWPEGAVLGEPNPIVPPDRREEFDALLDRVLTGDTFQGVEVRRRNRDGRPMTVHLSAAPLRDHDGDVTGVMAVVRDVSEAPGDGDARREAVARFRLLARATDDVVWDYDVAADRVWWSSALEERFGYAADDVAPGFAWWAERVHPDDREAVVDSVNAWLDGDGQVWRREYRFRRADGSYARVLARGHAIRNSNGAAERVVGTLTDLTARRGAERALRHRAELARIGLDALNAMGEGFVVTDGERILHANEAWERITGYAVDDANTLSRLLDATIPEGRPSAREMVRRVLSGTGPVGPVETVLLRKDGDHVAVEVTAARYDLHGVRRVVGLMRDVTDQQREREELRRHRDRLEALVAERTRHLRAANEELEAFAFRVSHDIRRHLRAIDFFGEALAEDHGDVLNDEGRAQLKRMRGEVGRLNDLVGDLLALSRASRGTLRREAVDLSAMARDIVGDLRAHDPHRRAVVEVAEGVTAEGDPRLVRLVLENLLGNAWKYTANEPEAHILFGSHRNGGGETVYFVRDNGVGFDPAEAPRLFEPFQRLHGDREFEGTGVGLATVQRIVERHGGRVWAVGAEGEGATFYFTLAG